MRVSIGVSAPQNFLCGAKFYVLKIEIGFSKNSTSKLALSDLDVVYIGKGKIF